MCGGCFETISIYTKNIFLGNILLPNCENPNSETTKNLSFKTYTERKRKGNILCGESTAKFTGKLDGITLLVPDHIPANATTATNTHPISLCQPHLFSVNNRRPFITKKNPQVIEHLKHRESGQRNRKFHRG